MPGRTTHSVLLPVLYILLQPLQAQASVLVLSRASPYSSTSSVPNIEQRTSQRIHIICDDISILLLPGIFLVGLLAVIYLLHRRSNQRNLPIYPISEKMSGAELVRDTKMSYQDKQGPRMIKTRQNDEERWDPTRYTQERDAIQAALDSVNAQGQGGITRDTEGVIVLPPPWAFSTRPSSQRSRPPPPPAMNFNHQHSGGPPLAPITPAESHDFGLNPQYHDEGFRYMPSASASMPPSPFSSRFHSNKIRKVKGHSRSSSTPKLAQSAQKVAMEHRNSLAPAAQFPLPTIRPITPPEAMSTPGSPVHPHHDERSREMRLYEYSRHYPQSQAYKQYDQPHHHHHHGPPDRDHSRHGPPSHDQHHYRHELPDPNQHRRAQSVPLPMPAAQTPTSSIRVVPTAYEENQVGRRSRGAEERGEGEFQPVMIFEQGRSLSGQKWRRKVTVFRSEVLEKLEKEGLIAC